MFSFDNETEEAILKIKTKIFADGADLNSMIELNKLKSHVQL